MYRKDTTPAFTQESLGHSICVYLCFEPQRAIAKILEISSFPGMVQLRPRRGKGLHGSSPGLMTESGLRGCHSATSLSHSLASSLLPLPSFFLASFCMESAYLYPSVCGPLAVSSVWLWSLSELIPVDYFLAPIETTLLMCLMFIIYIFMNLENCVSPLPTLTYDVRFSHFGMCMS